MKKAKAKLQLVIANQRNELREQDEKFNQAGNPDYDHFTQIENCMETKLEHFGKALKEMLFKEVKDNNKKMEEKINLMISENRSYAESVKDVKASQVKSSIPETKVDFRTIMKEARDEEIAEESEQKRRACNIILHGVKEDNAINKEEAKKIDEAYVASLFESLKVQAVPKSSVRIGTDASKRRPLKLIMSSEEDKKKVMSSLVNLKDQEKFQGLSVTDDYTLTQRQTIKEWLEKAKQKNAAEPADSQYVWRARGTPKNGMFLKKLIKRNPTVEAMQN